MPKTLFIYNRQHIKCKVVTDKINYLVKLEFSTYKTSEIFLSTESSDFTIPDNMPIGIYKVTCLVSYMHALYTKDQKYIILVKPTKLYISPTEIKLNERIHCYPYPDFVPTDVSEIKVIVNWTVDIDTDITEFFNFKPYVIEDTYLRIKEEGSFGVYEAYCKVIVHIFSHVYNLDGHFTFKVTGFSKPIIMEKQHKVPLFFFLYVTTMILISHYVVCYMTAFEKTLKRIHDMELLVILESIQVVQKEKMKKAYRKYNFSHDSLSKYIYNQISKIIQEKKRQFVNRVSKSLTFDHSILNSLGISSPKGNTINSKLTTDTTKENLTFFIEGLSEGPFKYPKEPNAQNLYIILIKKILKDDTIQMNRLKRLKGDVEQKESGLNSYQPDEISN